MKKIALLAIAVIGSTMPAYAQYSQYTPFNSTSLRGQPTYRTNGIWNNPNERYNRRQQALVDKLQRKLSQLEIRLRARSVSFRERARLNNEIRQIRWEISRALNSMRRY